MLGVDEEEMMMMMALYQLNHLVASTNDERMKLTMLDLLVRNDVAVIHLLQPKEEIGLCQIQRMMDYGMILIMMKR